MSTANRIGAALGLALVMVVASGVPSHAADGAVPQPPTTLWNFLGIPQGAHKIQDALINPRGNHPKLERKPALKRIADAANLESPNPAIKAAAKIKADADLAPQKIKAIKYLATVCCGCAKNKEDVKEALLAALDDCTEEVRYEAAIAFCQCAGNPCTACNRGSCCDAKMMNKLLKVAEGKDAQGCWLEPSARVRAAAANALNACRDVRGPTAPAEGEVPKKGEAPPPSSETTPGEKPAEPKPLQVPEAKGPADSSTGQAHGVTRAGYAEIQDGLPVQPAQERQIVPAGTAGPTDRQTVKTVPPRPVRPTAFWTSDVRFQGRIVPSRGQ